MNENNELREALMELARTEGAKGHIGGADVLIELIKGDFVFDPNYDGNEGWHEWKGHYYERIPGSVLTNRVMRILPPIYEDAAKPIYAEVERLKKEDADERDIKKKKAEADKLMEVASSLRFLGNVSQVIAVARGEQSIQVSRNQWDREQYILAFRNCLVDVRTGEVVEPKREHYITKVIPHEWRGLDAQCPSYDRFINDLFINNPHREEIVSFINRAIGIGIAGDAPKEKFALNFIGPKGDNGKTTFLNILGDLFGVFGGSFSKGILMQTHNENPEGPQAKLYTLAQQRVGWTSETNPRDVLDLGNFKRITGGDRVSCRTLQQKYVTDFLPILLLIIASNHALRMDTQDVVGIKRLVPIMFEESFTTNPDPNDPYQHIADRDMPKKVLAEAPGIFARFVREYIEYRRNVERKIDGLGIPQVLIEKREQARSEADPFEQFLAQECLGVGKVAGKPFWEAFKVFHKDAQLPGNISQQQFSDAMKKRFERKSVNGKNWYYGVSLREDTVGAVPDEVFASHARTLALDNSFDAADKEVDNIKDITIKAQTKVLVAKLRELYSYTNPQQSSILDFDGRATAQRLKERMAA